MVGQVYLGRYETIRLLGQGGMGRVFLARHLELDEPVVVKVMHDHIAADPVFRERFRREMRLMARFKHPHAVMFHDASLEDPQGPCIIMEYLAGVGLDKLLAKNGRFTPARLRRFLGQLCDVLEAAHTAGIVHRDLKPANLMILDPDTPQEKLKVMDFGLAQMTEQKGSSGPTEYAVGTPGYMPPEQVRGDEVDHRGDLYSVGAIVYQLLSGKMPFPGATPMEVLMAQATDGPITFASIGLGEAIPPAVEEVIRKALSLEPADRQQSAREFIEGYEAALATAYQSAPEPAPTTLPAPASATHTAAGKTANASQTTGTHVAVPTAAAVDLDATIEQLEAYMPEQIAAYKLKGFVEEVGGKIVQSVPGLIKVQLKVSSKALKNAGSGGLFSWLGLGPKYGLIDMELHMRKKEDAKKQSVLHITVMMRPAGGGPIPNNPEWDSRCALVFKVLKGYLMSQG